MLGVMWLLDGEMADGALQAEIRSTEAPVLEADGINPGLFR